MSGNATVKLRSRRARNRTATSATADDLSDGRRTRLLAGIIIGGIVLALVGLLGHRLYGAFSLLNRGDQVDVGGREMFILCEGSGAPTIILEHGLGSSGTEWQAVQDRLATTNLVCFRSRAGMGFSDGLADGGPPTAQDATDDLARVLAEADVPGPYVLVGHSFGGHIVRLFADQHPEDVVGMVLVDSTHEDHVPLLRQRLSPAAWSEVAGLFGTANPETMDFRASAQQLARTGALGDLRLVVLRADQQITDNDAAGISEAAAEEIEDVMDDLWPQLQVELAGLSSVSRHVTVEGSGHFIHTDRPEAVVDAVRWIVEP